MAFILQVKLAEKEGFNNTMYPNLRETSLIERDLYRDTILNKIKIDEGSPSVVLAFQEGLSHSATRTQLRAVRLTFDTLGPSELATMGFLP